MAANEAIQAGGNNGQLLSKNTARFYGSLFVAFFNQWSGINFILYYAPEILERAGLAERIVGQFYCYRRPISFSLLGLYLIDRIGRKQLLIIGSLGCIS